MDLEVFDNAHAGYGVNFDFQGCHKIFNIEFLLNYVNPDSEITYFSYFIDFMLFWVPFAPDMYKKLNFSFLICSL